MANNSENNLPLWQHDKEKFYNFLKKSKSQFEKFSYPEKLNWWEINCDPLSGGYENSLMGVNISVSPTNENDTELFNKYFLKHLLKIMPDFDIDIKKGKFFETLKTSIYRKEFIESEIKKQELEIEKLTGINASRKFPFHSEYKPLFDDYMLKGREPNWKEITTHTVRYFAKVKCIVDYKVFLEEQLMELKTETTYKNNLPVETLEKISHKIVLLYELGIIDFLKSENKELTDETFARLIGTIIGENINEETIRKNLTYINTKDKKSPINQNSINKVKSLLAMYGMNLKRLKEN